MKKIEETVRIHSYVERNVEKFQTDDGKKFDNETDALKHEEFLNNIKSIETKFKITPVNFDDFGLYYYNDVISCKLIYIDEVNEETVKYLSYIYEYLEIDSSVLDDIKLGWNFFIETEYESNGIGRWSGYNLYVENVNDVIKTKNLELELLKKYENK